MVSPSATEEATSAAFERANARGPSPTFAVGLELARSLGALCWLPVRITGFAFTRTALRAEASADLARPAEVRSHSDLWRASRARAPFFSPARPLDVFVACAETSGEIHACSLVRALRRELASRGEPAPTIAGIGGAALETEGVDLLARPVERASMGFTGPLAGVPYYLGVLRTCAERFQLHAPDVLVAVDSPALNVPLAHIAHRYGIPVVHFIAPQYWGWAPWRTRAYTKAVDRALTILPFEPAWFARRGVRAAHVGHPALDALASVPPSRPDERARELVLLPGSRSSIVERNLPWMLRAASRLRAVAGDVPVVIAHSDAARTDHLRAIVEREGASAWTRIDSGDLHQALARARAALSVSGTILVDLLHHRLPAVVVYRLSNRVVARIAPEILTVPWFSSVNLLAGREVLPEFSFSGEGPPAIGAAIERCYSDRAWREQCIAGLDLARQRLGPPGAAERAALEVLDVAERRDRSRSAESSG
jgi:lipid-A-disaccharide synthase